MKILILCHDYPPTGSVGAQRPHAWVDYFEQKGYEVFLVSRHDLTAPDQQEYEKNTQFALKRKLYSGLSLFLGMVFPFLDKKKGIFEKATLIADLYDIDIIIATGEPFVLFKYAQRISAKYSIPWIADYRDNWSNDPTLSGSVIFKAIYRRHFRIFEKSIVKSAALITTVGTQTAKRIEELFPKERIELIPNGHRIPVNFQNRPVKKNKLKISYFGRLYKHRDPSTFIAGVRDWLAKNHSAKLNLHFYGLGDFSDQKDLLLQLCQGLEERLEITPSVSYDELILQASDSNAFLMLADRNLPLTNGKMYDYLGLKRPILLCPNDQSVFNKLLTDQNCGYIADSTEDVVQILDEFWEHRGQDEYFTTPVLRETYSREKSSEELLNLIKEICVES